MNELIKILFIEEKISSEEFMRSPVLKILLIAFFLSIIIYIFYMILTPLRIELLPFLGVFVVSFIFVLIFELFLYLVKKHIV